MAIKVLNKNTFDYADRFDGLDYVFPAGKAVVVEEEQALVHIFGLGLPQPQQHAKMARAGWLKFNDAKGLAEGHAIYNNFVFSKLEPNWREQGETKTLHLARPEAKA